MSCHLFYEFCQQLGRRLELLAELPGNLLRLDPLTELLLDKFGRLLLVHRNTYGFKFSPTHFCTLARA